MRSFVVIALLVAAASAVPTFLRKNKSFPDGRIVGGDDIPITEVPWQISLQYYGSHICGGSVVNEKYVVTAAHCTDGSTAEDFTIRAGTDKLGKGGQEVKVTKINQNPKFDYALIDFDISILELDTPLELSDSVAPVQLPEQDKTWPEGTEVLVSGWGTTSEGAATLPDNLQGVKVNLVGKEACQKAYGSTEITDRMICAGVNGGGKDSCQGDSGGPLVVDKVLGGIVSWGAGCARPEYPGVYSNVPALRDYIKEITGL